MLSLRRRTKRKYSSLDEKALQIRNFVKPFFSEKSPSNAKIALIKDGEVISSDNETADVLNTFFCKIVSNVNLPDYPM